MQDNTKKIIYVGKAKDLKRRVNQYFDNRNNKNLKTLKLVESVADFEYIVTNSEIDALILENTLIKKHQPHYNILLKDAKTFPYIKINTQKTFPKVEITRKILKDNAKYFGPYLKGVSAKDIMTIISFVFQMRACNKNLKKFEKRECLNYFLGKCCAPCTQRINQEDYAILVEKVINFLKGNTKEVEEMLIQKMTQASQMEQFERAIELRELLNKLKNINNIITTEFTSNVNADIIGLFSYGKTNCFSVAFIKNGKMMGQHNHMLVNPLEDNRELLGDFLMQIYSDNVIIPSKIYVPFLFENKDIISNYLTQLAGYKVEILLPQRGKFKKLSDNANINAKEYLDKHLELEKIKEERTIGVLEVLQKKLKLKNFPQRIECYDISNISGTNQVASMVVFENGVPVKNYYRKFKIKWVEGANDFECLKEVLSRRMNELLKNDASFSRKPDLIVIDGGKGQLSSVSAVLRQYDSYIDLISLAKREEEIFIEHNNTPVQLLKSDYALQLLIRLRDEAHRFAITFHRQRRNKDMLKK